MNPESVNPGHSSNADGEKHKQLDRGVREMVSVLTHRLADLQQVHKDGSSHSDQDEIEHGVRIVTLAGSNNGATMRGDLDEKSSPRHGMSLGEQEGEGLSTYVNSNFQAINNSIMMGGSYSTNDPGVHMDISDFIDDHQGHNKHGKKGKKKDKETSKSDQNAQHSD